MEPFGGAKDIARTYTGQFFGCISDVPFSSVMVQDATYQSNSFGLEQYYMGNMIYGIITAVPEAQVDATLLAGLAILAVVARRKRRFTNCY